MARAMIAAQLALALSWVSVILELLSTGFVGLLAEKCNSHRSPKGLLLH